MVRLGVGRAARLTLVAALAVGCMNGCVSGHDTAPGDEEAAVDVPHASSSRVFVPAATDVATTQGVTFGGVVTNILTGEPVADAIVTIGDVSAITDGDGAYSLQVLASQELGFTAEAAGYYTRESAVSITGSTTINPEIIPQGDGFSLAFFDHVFRYGQQGTRRWLNQPEVEIWSQQLACIEPCGSAGYEVTTDAVPEHFETYAREAIAHMSDLSGGGMEEPVITMKSQEVGSHVSSYESSENIRFKYLKTFAPPYDTDGGATSGHATSDNAWVDAPISINGSASPSAYSNAIYVHEFAHAMGWIPGHPQGVSAVPEPSIMGPNPVVVTDADRLHGRVLYGRPPGSQSPDRDPPGFHINGE